MADSPTESYDICIIGAGPTGLFAAFYAGLRQMSVKILDSLETPGGQLATLYPEKYIYDAPGFSRILARDLVANLLEQANQYRPAYALGERVRHLHQRAGQFEIETDRSAHHAKSILIAAGIGSFLPRRLSLADVETYENAGLHYFVRRINDFQGRRVLIVGGGDSAVDWANTLEPVARSVTLIHRTDKFRAHESAVAKLLAGSARVLTFHELSSLAGRPALSAATLYDNRSKCHQTIEVDAVLVNIGFQSTLGPIAGWNLELDRSQIKVDHTMQTTRPGIFAAGDVCTYPGKLKLIATGFGEACTAVNHARQFTDPTARVFPGHSSEKQ